MALRELRASHGYAPAVLAVTGTNGKTTVTSLTTLLVQQAGKSVAVAGNIGPTLLDTLGQRLDAADLPEVWVLELSSFQLDGVQGFEPTAAAVLNISQDHLDWHGSLQAYAAAKARIFGNSALMVLNREDAAVMAMLPPPVRVKLQKPQPRAHVTFGADMPQRPGDFGIEQVHGLRRRARGGCAPASFDAAAHHAGPSPAGNTFFQAESSRRRACQRGRRRASFEGWPRTFERRSWTRRSACWRRRARRASCFPPSTCRSRAGSARRATSRRETPSSRSRAPSCA